MRQISLRMGARRALICAALAMLGCLASTAPARAGGGPENVLLVVNSNSWASMTVANYYIALRQIPPCNVLYLPWDGDWNITDVETFRVKILRPILDYITKRGLGGQIDYIVYSSDFPYQIDLGADMPGAKFATGSLTGLTYLWQFVLEKRKEVASLNSNWYYRQLVGDKLAQPTRGFRASHLWNTRGETVEKDGLRYALSTSIAWTSGRGTSVDDAIRMLERSVKADGTKPAGTIYFVQNEDIRSKTRQANFPFVVDELKKTGVKAEIIEGIVPRGKADVMGAMMGAVTLNFAGSGSQIMPGAICDHLTSYGGVLNNGGGHTPLTELIRFGAAGASGTVVEPFAIQAKFPHPAMHLHYARGCSLAESFYQGLYGPYQLMIVGEPLCQPWAEIPQVKIKGITPGNRVKGVIEIEPEATVADGRKIERFELFVDGQRAAQCAPGSKIKLGTDNLPDGYHALRVVGVDDSPIQTQGRAIVPVIIDNQGREVRFTVATPKRVALDKQITISAACVGAKKLVLLQSDRIVAELEEPSGMLKVAAQQLGQGPVTLQVIAILGDKPEDRVVSAPVNIEIGPPTLLRGVSVPNPAAGKEGLLLTAPGVSKPITFTNSGTWVSEAGVKPKDALDLSGYFHVTQPGMYQIQTGYDGEAEFIVDGQRIAKGGGADLTIDYNIPLNLAAGWHKLQVKQRTTDKSRLYIYFGGTGTAGTAAIGPQFKH